MLKQLISVLLCVASTFAADVQVSSVDSYLESVNQQPLSTLQFQLSLQQASTEVRDYARARLLDELRSTEKPGTVLQVSTVLADLAGAEAEEVVAGRLKESAGVQLRVALCNAAARLASRAEALARTGESPLCAGLYSICTEEHAPQNVVDSAVMAMAALGPQGCDRLLMLEADEGLGRRAGNVIYTALGESGDPRAIAVLRRTASSRRMTEGARLQAVHAIGQSFLVARSRGLPVDPAEAWACGTLIKRLIARGASDGSFAVAIRAAVKIAGGSQDPEIRSGIMAGLSSVSETRREAALEALFLDEGPQDPGLKPLLLHMVEQDSSDAVRASAQAVLDKASAQQSQ